MMHFMKQIMCGFLFVFSVVLLAGCGSSGSSSADPSDTDPSGTDTSFTGTVQLFDEAGKATDTISEGNPGTLKITVETSSGSLAVNQFLTVTTSKGAFLNSDGTAITNSSGVAEFTLVADGANGAGTIDVSVGGVTLDSLFAFQIGVPESVRIGSFVNGSFQVGVLLSSLVTGEKLSIGGTATIKAELAILDGGVYSPYLKSVDISFSTICPTAVVDQSVSTENGIATATYRGDGCSSESDKVTATASIAGSIITASTDLLLAKPAVGSISFVSAEPEHLALAGTYNTQFPAISTITFNVKDEAGNFAPNELVNFSLSTSIGGISISPLSAETNSEGDVLVKVLSGSVPTSVRVSATVNDSRISTVSSNLVISTGLADQNSFSIAAETLNPETWSIDGVEVLVTVRAADHFNNPVPDGTSIYFTTEGGGIDPSCLTVDGACTVAWRSQNPRPDDGRTTILATAIGEESFSDLNGSGRYESSADSLDGDMDEAFVDENKNFIRDTDEEFFDYNKDLLFTTKNGIYNGTLCEEGCTEELIHVRKDLVLSMSASTALITINPSAITLSDYVEVTLTVADINGNSMPGGTTVTIEKPENGDFEGLSSFNIPGNRTWPTVTTFALKTPPPTPAVPAVPATPTTPAIPEIPSAPAFPSGTKSSLQVKVTSPNGTVTIASVICTSP